MKNVVLITGASSGLGKETALNLLQKGYRVYGAARRVERMKDLESAGGKALALDITDPQQIRSAVDQILEAEGRLDVLVNNAGYAIYGAVEDTSYEDARRQFEVNLFGLAEMTKAVLPQMRKQGSGTIINLSSMGGKMYTPLGAWYHATKHALEGWSDCLRLELKAFGIDVVIIEPGVIRTEFAEVMSGPMLERSGKGAYAELTHKIAAATENSYRKKNSSHPRVVAQAIARAIAARKPKTRYVAGKMARPLMWVRKYLGDRIYDAAVMSQVK